MRAQRRSDERRMKARARRILRRWFRDLPGIEEDCSPRAVGRFASVHCRPCSCWMCRSDDEAAPPRRERPFHDPDCP